MTLGERSGAPPAVGAMTDLGRIAFVEVVEYEYEMKDLGVDGAGFTRVYERNALARLSNFALAIETDRGFRGEYCPVFCGKKPYLAQVLHLAPRLLGRDAAQRELIYNDFKRAQQAIGFLGVGAIDICLWDLAAKALGTTVSSLLGGFRTSLRAYASCMHGDRNGQLSSPAEVAAYAEQCREAGYTAFKLRGWSDGDPQELAQTIETTRATIGGDTALMVDPAGDLRTYGDTLIVAEACDAAGAFWLEDPLRDGGISQNVYRRLREKIQTPLLIGEHVRGVEPKADWIVSGATDFVRADPEADLGITGCMKIAHLAEAFGLDVEIHGSGPAHRACMSAIRNTNFYEIALVGPLVGNFVSPPVYRCGYSDQPDAIDRRGRVPVPQGQGLGVVYDRDLIDTAAVARHEFRA